MDLLLPRHSQSDSHNFKPTELNTWNVEKLTDADAKLVLMMLLAALGITLTKDGDSLTIHKDMY